MRGSGTAAKRSSWRRRPVVDATAGIGTLCTLAAAYAEAGRYDEAVAAAKAAVVVAQEKGESNVVETARQWLQLYEAHKAYRLERK